MATSTPINSTAYQMRRAVLPTFETFSSAAIGTTVLATGIPGKRILVLSASLGCAGANQVATFFCDPNTLAAFHINSGNTIDASFEKGIFVTEDGEDLNLTLSVASSTVGTITYIYI